MKAAADGGTPRGPREEFKGRLGTGNVFDLLEDLPRVSLDRLYGLEGHALTAAAEAASGEKSNKLIITFKRTPSTTAGGEVLIPGRVVQSSNPCLH